MPTRMARLQAQPEDVNHVRQALGDMIREASEDDPTLGEYVLYESEDTPGEFLIEQRISAVDAELEDRANARLMELGTGLREETGPIRISNYRLVTDSGL